MNHNGRAKTLHFSNTRTHLFLLSGLVHFGLQKVNEFGLLRNSTFHFHLFVRIENLKIHKNKNKLSPRKKDAFKFGT